MGLRKQLSEVEVLQTQSWMTDHKRPDRFPNIRPLECKVVHPCVEGFNCIAWTVDYTEGDVWPNDAPGSAWPIDPSFDDSIETFHVLYTMVGRGCHYQHDKEPPPMEGASDVALYCDDLGNVTHGAIRTGFAPWTSKLGFGGPIVEHELSDLAGGNYGSVRHFFRRWPPTPSD